MKLKITILGLFLSAMVSAQVSDLMKLADGKLTFSSMLYDSSDKLFGYFYLYERDVDKDSKKLEYVLLDKNLNKVNNGEFSMSYNPRILYHFDDCTLIDDKIILSKSYAYIPFFSSNTINYLTSTFQIITLKDKHVSPEYVYNNGEFKEAPSDLSVLKSENKRTETKYIINAFAGSDNAGFYVTEYNKNNQNYLEKDLMFFNKDLTFKWKYTYNPEGTPDNFSSFRFLHFKNNNLYIMETTWAGLNAYARKIVALDFATGKKKYEYRIEFPGCEHIHRIWAREVDSHLYIVGDYVKESSYLNFDYKKRLGFYRIVLNNDGTEADSKYIPWSGLSPFATLNEKGKDADKFTLNPKRFFIFNNKKISIVTEQYRSSFWSTRTGKIVVLNFDTAFHLQSADTIYKEESKLNGSGFLFSQYIRNDTAAIFFYRNVFNNKETDKQEVVLGINMISDGKVTEEKVPLYSKNEYYIDVLPAKEGFIMLREYNGNAKYNQIRLEKLNYE